MLIYLTILIPILALLVLFLFFRDRLHWGEAIAMLAIPLVLIFSLKALAVYSATMDTEWRGGYAVSATYYEAWNEYIHKTCSRESCSGSGKTRSCTTTYYDCSYVDYHREYWALVNNMRESFGITQSYYDQLVSRWGNKYFVEMNRPYYTQDGNAYRSDFDNTFDHLEPTTSQHSYENRVAVSNSIFNFREIDGKDLANYPKVSNLRQQCLIGIDDPDSDLLLQKINGLLGAEKQVRVFFLVWKNQPLEKAFDQQQYWKNGNKNELVINVGVDDSNNVSWAYVFSWSNEQLQSDVKDYLVGKPLDLKTFLSWLPEQVKQKWVRKSFKDFAYIAVEPSTTWILVIVLITTLTTAGLGFFCVTNEINNEDNKNDRFTNWRYGYRSRISDCSGLGVDSWTRFTKYLQSRGYFKDPSGSETTGTRSRF